jgi:hypothetical protein
MAQQFGTNGQTQLSLRLIKLSSLTINQTIRVGACAIASAKVAQATNRKI